MRLGTTWDAATGTTFCCPPAVHDVKHAQTTRLTLPHRLVFIAPPPASTRVIENGGQKTTGWRRKFTSVSGLGSVRVQFWWWVGRNCRDTRRRGLALVARR